MKDKSIDEVEGNRHKRQTSTSKQIKFTNCMLTLYEKEKCNTIFKTLNEWVEDIKKSTDKGLIKFAVGQEEICPTTNKKHLQTYIEFEKEQSLKSIREMLNDFKEYTIYHIVNGKESNLQKRKGSQNSAIKYCTKKDTRKENGLSFEFGEKKVQGKRSDLDDIVDMVYKGHTRNEILIEHKGNALRHLHFIKDAMLISRGFDALDKYVTLERKVKNRDNDITKEELNEYFKLKDKFENI